MYYNFFIHSSVDGHLGSAGELLYSIFKYRVTSSTLNKSSVIILHQNIISDFGEGSFGGWVGSKPHALYPEKTTIQKESCTTVFIAALFTIARTWKQPKCPSSDEWIKNMWHIYTMEYYSAIKRDEIELFVVRWMDLESVIQSEVSQKEKNKYCMLTHIYGI